MNYVSRFTQATVACLALVAASISARGAFIVPEFRGGIDTSYGVWNVLSTAYSEDTTPGTGNLADVESSSGFSGEFFQTGTDTAFVTSGGNIYSFAAATSFSLTNSDAFLANTVVLQLRTLGTELDYGSVFLWVDGIAYAPAYTSMLSYEPNVGFGGGNVDWAAQWDLSGIGGALEYEIVFAASGSSMSMDAASLDSSAAVVSQNILPVPEPGGATLVAMAVLFTAISVRRRFTRA